MKPTKSLVSLLALGLGVLCGCSSSPPTAPLDRPEVAAATVSAQPAVAAPPPSAPCTSPIATNDGPVCQNGAVHLFASTVAGATYSWTGPQSFTSTLQNPTIAQVNPPKAGTYSVTVTAPGCTTSAPATTVVVLIGPNGACDDHNNCTTSDKCQGGSGTCSGTAVSCAATACRQAGSCIPATGLCSGAPKADGTACDDSSKCTSNDACLNGNCVGTAVVCTSTNDCELPNGTCNPNNGNCSFTDAPDGTACSTGDACTVAETCKNGKCKFGSSLNCNDSNPCTNDSCNSASGCVHTNNTATCSDGSACTLNDTCSGGVCVGGPAPNCDDADPCTIDSCNPVSACQHLDQCDQPRCRYSVVTIGFVRGGCTLAECQQWLGDFRCLGNCAGTCASAMKTTLPCPNTARPPTAQCGVSINLSGGCVAQCRGTGP